MGQTIINFNEINVSNRHVYYPVNTCVRIALISSLIDGFSRTNCQPWVHPKGIKETPLLQLCNGSTAALLSPTYSHPYNRPCKRLYIASTNGFATSLRMALRMALRTALQRLYKWLCNGSTNGFMNGSAWLYNGFMNGLFV